MSLTKTKTKTKKSSTIKNKNVSSRKNSVSHPNLTFKMFTYKLSGMDKICEEIANECTKIESMGGEVFNVIYNTYVPWHARKNNKKKGASKRGVCKILLDGVVSSVFTSEQTIVYILYNLNKVNIKKPRQFYYFIDKAVWYNSNNVIGDISVMHYNKVKSTNYTHICTLMDSYTPLRGFCNGDGYETTFIITFYAK
tara:strand:- start:2960 stop:3547 length:588 start_codon:yes stop_codon:yes gene_type:complete